MGEPSMAPLGGRGGDPDQLRWHHLDNSVNAVSFGFVATAILISMFLVMAIVERFFRPAAASSPAPRRRAAAAAADLEAQRGPAGKKLEYPSPKMSVYAKGVSVLMPGYDIPTFIAHPAPPPCPPERVAWPSHQQSSVGVSTSNSS